MEAGLPLPPIKALLDTVQFGLWPQAQRWAWGREDQRCPGSLSQVSLPCIPQTPHHPTVPWAPPGPASPRLCHPSRVPASWLQSFLWARFPSIHRGSASRRWVLPDRGVHSRCFTTRRLFSAKPLLLASQHRSWARQDRRGPSPACTLPRQPLLHCHQKVMSDWTE